MASFGVSRVFKAGTAMLAAAKSGAATAAATTAAKKTKAVPAASSAPKPKRTAPTRQSGIFKALPISPELRRFLGTPESSRTDAVKKIWDHIKLNNLQNPSNRREIMCDEKLKVVFGKDKVQFLEIGKLLSPHFQKTG